MKKNVLYRVFIALIITAIIVCNFCFGYSVSYSLLLLLLLLFIALLGDEYQEISIGKIRLLKYEIGVKNEEIKNLKDIINIKNTQKQELVNVNNISFNGEKEIKEDVSNSTEQKETEEKEVEEVMQNMKPDRKRYDREKVEKLAFKKFLKKYELEEYEKTKNVQIELKQVTDTPTRFDYKIKKGNKTILVDIRPNNFGFFYRDQLYRKLIEIKTLRESPLEPDIQLYVVFYSMTDSGHRSLNAMDLMKKTYDLAIKNELLDVFPCDITEEEEKEYDLILKDSAKYSKRTN